MTKSRMWSLMPFCYTLKFTVVAWPRVRWSCIRKRCQHLLAAIVADVRRPGAGRIRSYEGPRIVPINAVIAAVPTASRLCLFGADTALVDVDRARSMRQHIGRDGAFQGFSGDADQF